MERYACFRQIKVECIEKYRRFHIAKWNCYRYIQQMFLCLQKFGLRGGCMNVPRNGFGFL